MKKNRIQIALTHPDVSWSRKRSPMTLNRIMRYIVKKKIHTMAQMMLLNEISASTTSLLLERAADRPRVVRPNPRGTLYRTGGPRRPCAHPH